MKKIELAAIEALTGFFVAYGIEGSNYKTARITGVGAKELVEFLRDCGFQIEKAGTQ